MAMQEHIEQSVTLVTEAMGRAAVNRPLIGSPQHHRLVFHRCDAPPSLTASSSPSARIVVVKEKEGEVVVPVCVHLSYQSRVGPVQWLKCAL